MAKRIFGVIILVILSTGWVFPMGACATYWLKMLDNPLEIIDGHPLKWHITMNLSFGLMYAAIVCALWTGYLGYKHFPAPGDCQPTPKK